MTLKELGFSVRTYNALTRGKRSRSYYNYETKAWDTRGQDTPVTSLDELLLMSPRDLLEMENLGFVCLREIRGRLDAMKLQLRDDTNPVVYHVNVTRLISRIEAIADKRRQLENEESALIAELALKVKPR